MTANKYCQLLPVYNSLRVKLTTGACAVHSLKGGEGVAYPSHTQFQNSLIKVNYILLKIVLDNSK